MKIAKIQYHRCLNIFICPSYGTGSKIINQKIRLKQKRYLTQSILELVKIIHFDICFYLALFKKLNLHFTRKCEY